MSQLAVESPKRKTNADYVSEINQLMADMDRINALMNKDNDIILYLKAESARLHAETQQILTRLKTTFK